MNKKPIQYQLNGFEWSSENKDLQSSNVHLLARVLFDIQMIHKFEEVVLRLKNEDCVWGPVHSSVGQEAVAAGTTAALSPHDKFLGTHRSHHQFLSKALQYSIPQNWNPAKESLPAEAETVVRKTLAEIMGLEDGVCGGRGGSMHLRWEEAGFLGSNAIVGGGLPLATGAAFAEKYRQTGNVVVAFFGEGAVNQGAFHEACNLAGLWKLPVIYFLENNEYAVGTSFKKTCAANDLCLRASSYGMNFHRVQGYDPVAIYELTKEVAEGMREDESPCLIEAKCYRRYHHAGDQPGSAFQYRSKEEEEYYRNREVVKNFPELLLEEKILTKKEIDHVQHLADEAVQNAVDYYTTGQEPRQVKSQYLPSPDSVSVGIRSDGSELQNVTFREREHFHDFQEMKYSDAIAAATGGWFDIHSDVIVLGEEVANFGGGAYGATKGLPDKYPDRVLNTPISEAGFTGLGLGAAMSGIKPIVEIMFPDFTLVAADQVFNQIGKARHMYGNTTDIPLVLRTRIAVGCGYGGQHSMDPVGLYALFSGWRIVAPSNAFDYVGLFNTAMQSNDPVLIMEHHALYSRKFPVPADNLDYFVEFGKARVMKEGTDVTLIAYGYMAQRIEKLCSELENNEVSPEVIDLRTVDIPSLDFETLGTSLEKTGAAVIVEEAPENHSIGGKIAAELTERFFDYLDSPVMRVPSMDVPNPVSRILEDRAILGDHEIVEMVAQAATRQWK